MPDVPTAADRAYQAALWEIERVRAAGGTKLDFNRGDFFALDRIPETLRSLQGVLHVALDKTSVADLSPLRDLTGLESLTLQRTNVANLSPLQGLTGLGMLWLSQTAVADLLPLRGLAGLQELWLNETAVADLTPLQGLKALRRLRLDQTAVSDLSPLQGLIGLQWLTLNQTAVADLSPLQGLTGLQTLRLNQTAVADLSPLQGLTGLRWLSLSQTAVADLRPIRNLPNLVDKGGGRRPFSGVAFTDTPATRRDPQLARLAAIKDDAGRTEAILAYLHTLPPWPEPYLPATPTNEPDPPEQDPALPLIWGERGFTFLAGQVDSDPVTEAALDDLRALLQDLRRKGNRHDDLYRLAGEMIERSAGDIPTLHMVRLHLTYQKLRRLYQDRSARAERFDDETVTALGSVLEIAPGVTLADAGVQVLIIRQDAERARPADANAAKAEADVLQAVLAADAPFDADVQDAAAAILQPDRDDRLSATRRILSRNTVVAVLKFTATAAVTGVVGNFVYAHVPVLLNMASTLGDDALFWARMVLERFQGEYEVAMGILREGSSLGRWPGTRRRDDGRTDGDS